MAGNNNSLNSVGATGNQSYLEAPVYNQNTGGYGSTPQAKALSSSTSSTPKPLSFQDQVNADLANHYKVMAAQNNGPLKSLSTSPDGAITSTYHQPTDATTSSKTKSTTTPAPTYGGVIGQGTKASQNAADTGSSNYNTANEGLLNASANNQQYANRAKQIADAAGQKISDIGGQGAKGEAGYLSTGTSPVAEGNAQLLQNSIAAQQRAVSEGANTQLTGNAQGLTANQQAQSGYNSASGNALNSQGQGISGLGSNAGLLSPTSNIILRDPTTGAVVGDQNLSDLARTAGNLSGIQSGAASAAGATGTAQAALTQNYQSGLAQLRNADNLAPQIAQTLASNPNLNQTPISAITNLNQWFAGQTSQPGQQQLSQQVAAYVQALGLTPDQAAAIASQQGGTIGTLLNTLYNAAKAKVDANNPANINSGSSSGSSTGGGLYNF